MTRGGKPISLRQKLQEQPGAAGLSDRTGRRLPNNPRNWHSSCRSQDRNFAISVSERFQLAFRTRALAATAAVISSSLALAPHQARAALANPNVSVNESLSSLPSNSDVILLNLGTSGVNGLVSEHTLIASDGSVISFSGSSGLYSGNVKGVTAAPWTNTGPDKNNYYAAEPSGGVTVTYKTPEKYFGMLWGSVDFYNTLSFYQGNTLVESISGSQIAANANGSQTANGSYFVNFNFNNGTSFDRVVATSSTPAFEFDTIAYSQTNIPVIGGDGGTPTVIYAVDTVTHQVLGAPAPMPMLAATPLGAMLLMGMAGLLRRKRADG
jgi:hypothetical protein